VEAKGSGQVTCVDMSVNCATIRRIIRDWMTDVGQMGANLMRSTGNGLAFDKTCPSILRVTD
jgi:hypothetical protein